MRSTLSARLLAAIHAQRTGEVLLAFVDLNCNGTHLYLVNDTQNQTYNSQVYTSFPFQLRAPDDVSGQIPVCFLVLDNTDRSVMQVLQASLSGTTRPTVTVYTQLASQIGTLEWTSETFTVTDAQDNETTISLTCSVPLTADEPFPGDTFNPGNFPSLFINPAITQESL